LYENPESFVHSYTCFLEHILRLTLSPELIDYIVSNDPVNNLLGLNDKFKTDDIITDINDLNDLNKKEKTSQQKIDDYYNFIGEATFFVALAGLLLGIVGWGE
jgi:hypothetical protein